MARRHYRPTASVRRVTFLADPWTAKVLIILAIDVLMCVVLWS